MAHIIKDNPRIPSVASTLATGVTAPAGASFPINHVHVREPRLHRIKVEIPSLTFALTAASGGGAADAQGQKLIDLPAGKWLVLATDYNFTVTTASGYSASSAVFSLGTAAATADNAALTSTEADVCASQTLGDGTLAAGASETEDTTVLGTGTAPAIIGSSVAAGPTGIYFNIGGSWIHATLTDALVTINGTVELILLDLGVAS